MSVILTQQALIVLKLLLVNSFAEWLFSIVLTDLFLLHLGIMLKTVKI